MIINGTIPGDPEEVAKAEARLNNVAEMPQEEQNNNGTVLTPEPVRKSRRSKKN